jgi:hypothetical protein
VALALASALLGATEAFGTPALPAILLHNLCAAILLALLAGRLAGVRLARR